MRNESPHLSDEDLLLSADGELSRRRNAQVRAHLAECWSCRARMAKLEETISHFVRAHDASLNGLSPPEDGPRALLKARLRELNASENAPVRHSLFRRMSAQFAMGCVAILFVLAGAAIWKVHGNIVEGRTDAAIAAINWKAVPDRNLTPGATRHVSLDEVCAPARDNENWTVPATVRKRVLQEYGMPETVTRGYELDYLITPELGGANDARNLWPEPYSSTPWNAHVKDALENRLHAMVCSGQIDLPSAQRDIADDWVAAYKKYFHTDKPIPGASI